MLLIALVFFSCNNKEEEKPVEVYHIQDLGTLATTEYTYGKILQLNDDQDWYRIGDRKILISVKAKAKAGIDLTKMTDKDITEKNENTIELKLPSPEIISFDMDPSDVRTEMTDINGFRMDFTQEEKMKILKLGEVSIRKEMGESNILNEAKKNARIFLSDFYKDLGYENVIIDFKPSEQSSEKK